MLLVECLHSSVLLFHCHHLVYFPSDCFKIIISSHLLLLFYNVGDELNNIRCDPSLLVVAFSICCFGHLKLPLLELFAGLFNLPASVLHTKPTSRFSFSPFFVSICAPYETFLGALVSSALLELNKLE